MRGGESAVDSLIYAYGSVTSMPGHYGFSVQYQPGKTVDELAAVGQFPHGKISYATNVQLKSVAITLGYDIHFLPTYNDGPGFHHDLEVVSLPSLKGVELLPGNLAEGFSLTFAIKPNPFRH